MKLLPITLGIVGFSIGTQNLIEQIDAETRQKILERDGHTCRYCGFKSEKYQDVNLKNLNAKELKLDNLATACIFCHQCFDMRKVSDMKSGVLLWLPEVKQWELHHIARAIYVARISQGNMAETAKKALDVIRSRREQAKERLGTDDPQILSHVMEDFLTPRHYAKRKEKLEGVRLFPLDRRIIKEGDLEFNQFPQILAYWRSKNGPFGGRVPNQWKDIYANFVK